MIKQINNAFMIQTKNTSYILSYQEDSKLFVHNYYGRKINLVDLEPLIMKLDGGMGNALVYRGIRNCFIDNLDLEVSTIGKGDYRESSVVLFNEKLGYTYDFRYVDFEIKNKEEKVDQPLPSSFGYDEVLIVHLYDEVAKIKLDLFYKVYVDSDVIVKYAKITSQNDEPIYLERLMSNQLDLKDSDYQLLTFDGAWGKERHVNERELKEGIYINDSKLGVSSARHNPLVILKRHQTGESMGECFGFNLVYSGNHASIFEVTVTKKLRVLSGINFFAFKHKLTKDESFITPESVLTYSSIGLNQLSQNFHNFINHSIIPKQFQFKPRPIVINSWEGTYFKFTESSLLKLAKQAKKLGIELFVLDDGWFGKRDKDDCSLGDYSVHSRKLPKGLKHLAQKINDIGLDFGLWVEPEMISVDSDLYRKNPSWAVKIQDRPPSIGRNQLVLDLTNKDVQDYLIEQLSSTFASCNLKYVKWDFNRPLSDMYSPTLANNGEFFHRYTMGLYRVMDEITKRFPHLLFEGCASGGNRFDLGILCFMPQIWTSDDTDYYERIFIQTGTSYGYPLSTISNHVSSIPNHQTLRNSPLSSRFNLAMFGVLGYELNLIELTKREKNEIANQVKLYKKQRMLLQFGTFYRNDQTIFKTSNTTFQVIDENKDNVIVGFFQGLLKISQKEDIIKINDIDEEALYEFKNVVQKLNVRMFGGLVNYTLKRRIKINGVVYNVLCYYYKLESEKDDFVVYGSLLKYAGIRLKQQFMGTGHNEKVRVLGDFGSRIYLIKKKNIN